MPQNTFLLSITLSTAFVDSFNDLLSNNATNTATNSNTNVNNTVNVNPLPITNLNPSLNYPSSSLPLFTPLMLNNIPIRRPISIPEEIEGDVEEDEGFNTDDCLDDDLESLYNYSPTPEPRVQKRRITSSHIFNDADEPLFKIKRTNANLRKKSVMISNLNQGAWHCHQYRLPRSTWRRHSFY
ncbi:hypothetical protein K502DRAFT_333044 [Neoconidiobolus thromboides FSU 785]|nr:hypothetical protein K502DRAFT_333044 [Neoconidiobolus thromboides FSU 785]